MALRKQICGDAGARQDPTQCLRLCTLGISAHEGQEAPRLVRGICRAADSSL